ncbi:TRAP transporter large permease [Siminovitchia sp. FSL H7-0308]|uniref:Tripartite ATP-independent transporter DctM subunit n=1 Tax=Siminovitchia thermophila TaxID=1245522 RepID=A0ABS2RE96_9BACI|nr:TRAP transporter large permease [Siminovitchia thermophila]MBM7717675.1 tripartite ATP-independent transporter DctM subunit [Siminovitchia thermophila]
MEWYIVLTLIFLGLAFLFGIGMPVAFAFLVVNTIAVFILWNGTNGVELLTMNMFQSVSLFSLLPIPMFILMGEIMFRTGVGACVFEALGKWLGALPGRLSLLAVGSGTLFSALSGSSVASTALLGSFLVPEMEKKGYSHKMSIGPILGSAGLATMIPPTALGVILASLAGIPVGHFLVAIVIPGLLLALIFVAYVTIRCALQPELAPSYHVEKVSLAERIIDTIKYIMPIGLIVAIIVALIMLGIATPTESAVLGAVAVVLLAAFYKRLTYKLLLESLHGTLKTTAMILMIMAGASIFSQLLSFTGITEALILFFSELSIHPILVLIILQVLLIILGCFLEPVSIMMMTLPLLMPIIGAVGFDKIWFSVILLLNMQLATITPPFGMDLFAMKGVLADKVSMGQIYRAVTPFILLNVVCMGLLIVFPQLVLWLPSLM